MIEVTVNGQVCNLERIYTIAEVLKDKGIKPELVAVELNGEIIDRNKYKSTRLRSGDILEYLHYMAGGCFLIRAVQDLIFLGMGIL